jgi:hypothetical protein
MAVPAGSGWTTDLVLDSNGTPHLAYSVYSHAAPRPLDSAGTSATVRRESATAGMGAREGLYTLYYATKQGGAWSCQTVASYPSDAGLNYNPLALASSSPEESFIAYQNENSVRLARRVGQAWVTEVFDYKCWWGTGDRLGLTIKQGYPYVAYNGGDCGDGSVIKIGGSGAVESWSIASFAPGYGAVLTTANDTLHVLYRDENLVLRHAWGGYTSMTTEEVPLSAAEDYDLAVDNAGTLHVTAECSGVLGYARKSNGVWTTETIDSVNEAGHRGHQLAVDAFGIPHVAYRTNPTYPGELRYAVRAVGGWEITRVDSVGWFPSLALNELNLPVISYWAWNPSGLHLRYATLGEASGLLPDDVPAPGWSGLTATPVPSRSAVALQFRSSVLVTATVDVVNVEGRLVRRLVDGNRETGQHRLTWDGRDEGGRPMPGGIYFAVLKQGTRQEIARMALVR